MKKILFAALMAMGTLQAQPAGGGSLRKVTNTTFGLGEKLQYRVHYGAVTAGNAVMFIDPQPVEVHGRQCYHMVGQGISSKSFSMFFKVNDRYETFVDMDALVPWKFKRKIDEGNFRQFTEVNFDQYSHTAVEKKSTRPVSEKADNLPHHIQDVMSAFYYARTQDYSHASPGDTTRFQNYLDKKVYDLDVIFLGRETITVEGGKFKCVKLKPLVREGGLFRHQGDMYLWISDDLNRIPIRVEAGLVVGSIQVDFVKAEGLKNPFISKIG